MRRPLENWILSCGHTRAMGVDDGLNAPGDDARCYECPAENHRNGQRTAPMKKLVRKEAY